MYGYMLLNKKFYELGEIELFHDEYSGYEYTMACPSDSNVDLSDITSMYRVPKTWYMSTKEGEVYQCRTVWLIKDDSEKAKSLFRKALKDRYDREIESATLKYENALSGLK